MGRWKNLLHSATMTALAVTGGAQAQDHHSKSGVLGAFHFSEAYRPYGPVSGPLAPAVVRTSSAYTPLTAKERLDLYVRRAFLGPGAFFRAAGPALAGHLKNQPPEWQQGLEGFGRRFANRFGRFALKETYEAAGAAALGHEVRYLRSSRSGFLPRAGHALAATVTTYDKNGRRVVHAARLGAAFAAEFTGNLWMPAGYRTSAQAVRGVGLELGIGSVINLFREFSPELTRILPWR